MASKKASQPVMMTQVSVPTLDAADIGIVLTRRAEPTNPSLPALDTTPQARPDPCCCWRGEKTCCSTILPRIVGVILDVIKTLRKFSRYFWLLCIAQFFASYAYFATALQLTTFFVSTVGVSDFTASTLYGGYGIAASLWPILLGPVSDIVGIYPFLIIVPLLGCIGRVLMVVPSTSVGMAILPDWVIYIALFGLVALCDGSLYVLFTSMATRLLKAHGSQRKIGFGILYSFQNLGAMIAGFGLDFIVAITSSKGPAAAVLRLVNVSQVILIAAACGMFLTTVFTLFLCNARAPSSSPPPRVVSIDLDKSDAEEGGGSEDDESGSSQQQRPWRARCYYTIGTLGTCSFWRFFLFCIFCVGIKMIFRQLDMTFPTYMRRTFGPDAPVGTMYAIDPMLIIVLSPLVQAFTADFSPMRWITLGAWITGFSAMILAFATPGLLDLGGVILFGIVLALGESLWSPLLNDYAASVAGKSRMGIYMAATAPIMFVSKFPAGWLSGWLLARYCPSNPSNGPCDALALWMIISIVTLVSSPLMLTLFYNIIYDPVVRRRWNHETVTHHLRAPAATNEVYSPFNSHEDSASDSSSSISVVELDNRGEITGIGKTKFSTLRREKKASHSDTDI
jgi:MFS family permease